MPKEGGDVGIFAPRLRRAPLKKRGERPPLGMRREKKGRKSRRGFRCLHLRFRALIEPRGGERGDLLCRTCFSGVGEIGPTADGSAAFESPGGGEEEIPELIREHREREGGENNSASVMSNGVITILQC